MAEMKNPAPKERKSHAYKQKRNKAFKQHTKSNRKVRKIIGDVMYYNMKRHGEPNE